MVQKDLDGEGGKWFWDADGCPPTKPRLLPSSPSFSALEKKTRRRKWTPREQEIILCSQVPGHKHVTRLLFYYRTSPLFGAPWFCCVVHASPQLSLGLWSQFSPSSC